jgi:serine protease Do
MADATPGGDGPDRTGIGLAVEPLTPEKARRLGVDADTGLLVTNVDPSGPAADAGLQRGDVIEEVEGTPVKSVAELRSELSRAGDRPALMLVRRGESSLYLTLDQRQS